MAGAAVPAGHRPPRAEALSGRAALELLGAALIALIIVGAVLSGAQAARLADLLPPAQWPAALGLAALILLEAVLPLTALLACGLAYGRWRAEGALVARQALGHSPSQILAPALGLGLVCALVAAWLAAGPTPEALVRLRGMLVEGALGGLVQSEQVSLPGGGALRREGDAVWALLPAGDAPPLLLHARLDRQTKVGRALQLRLKEVRLWGQGLRVSARSSTLDLDAHTLERRLGMLGPPNALRSAELGSSAHHRFTWHRRLALPAMAPLWALLGALLGGRFGGARAVLGSAAAVGLAYWFLRTGELSARAGLLSPAIAAWAPLLLLGLGLLLWARLSARRGGPG